MLVSGSTAICGILLDPRIYALQVCLLFWCKRLSDVEELQKREGRYISCGNWVQLPHAVLDLPNGVFVFLGVVYLFLLGCIQNIRLATPPLLVSTPGPIPERLPWLISLTEA